jgi:hypothetical protein
MILNEQLILEVAKGNPGAIVIIGRLQYFSKWYDMMQWCRDNLVGEYLWMKYKDDFHYDIMALGNFIQEQMSAAKKQ